MNRATIGMVLALGVATALTATGCSGGDSESASLKGLDGNEVSITNSDASVEPTWAYGSLPVCLAKGSKAQLTGLRLDATAGVELIAAGVRRLGNKDSAVGDQAGPLPATYTRIPGAIVTSVCETKPITELAFEVRHTGAASSKINSVELTYKDGATTRKLSYPFRVILCSHKKATDLPKCSE